MDIKLIKPYEISVWEEKLDENTNQLIENKLAVIGSDTMTGLNKIYDPVFTKKTNGEKTLTFSLKYKYFDPYSGNDGIVNPFAAMLVNERKVKLYYDDEWYEFIIKDHSESSEEFTWTYTCYDAFVLELSKTGYNITFDAELNNNQGTAYELATETVKNTDWKIGESDILKQLVAEPIYKAVLHNVNRVDIIDADTEQAADFNWSNIYLFYTYVKNKDGKFVQFIERKDDEGLYTIDDKNVITAVNYRIENELYFNTKTITIDGVTKDVTGFYLSKDSDVIIIEIEEVQGKFSIDKKFQANRSVYNQWTTYDPVMGRTVDIFEADGQEIYRYTDYAYSTSNVIMNYITNGDNFNILEDGSLQGWNPYTDQSSGSVNKLELVTYPEVSKTAELIDLAGSSQVEGFLKVIFNGAKTINNNKVCNTVYNSGIQNHISQIQSIAKGQKFVLRWRAKTQLAPTNQPFKNLRAIIAKYDQDTPSFNSTYLKHFTEDDIILEFDANEEPIRLDNIITGGELFNDETQYIIDGVPQVPSTKYKYLYQVGNENLYYIWEPERQKYVLENQGIYLPYYYVIGQAKRGVTNTELKDSKRKVGLFIYSTVDVGNPVYIQDIQLTQFIADGGDENSNTPVLIGNVPVAGANKIDYYYLKPTSKDITAEDIRVYADLDSLRYDYSLGEVKPLYNEKSEKVLSISASQSNCFNILQTIAETFECWIKLEAKHDNNGYILRDTSGQLEKYIHLQNFVGKDNYAGFKYGINLQSIERTVNSDEIVTKLIVDDAQSDYVDKGYVSISDAPSNNSGEAYILNFDYYYNQGLLDRENVEADYLDFITQLADINISLKEKNEEYNKLKLSLTNIESQRNVYSELVSTAQDNKNRGLEKFDELVGESYDSYRQKHPHLSDDQKLTEEETILKTIGELYTSSTTINNYSGLLTNIDNEYWSLRKQIYGSEVFYVTIYVERDALNQRHICVEFSDYLDDFYEIVGGEDCSFIVDGDSNKYKVTTNKKYFDILSETARTITFYPSENYTIQISTLYINDKVTIKNRITTNMTELGLNDQIDDLIEQKTNLINEFENRYRRFIQEGAWSSTEYIDSERYYLDALQVSNISAQPTISYSIKVVEISSLEDLNDYEFDVGDKTYIEDTEFFGWSNKNGFLTPAREEVIVSEAEWHLDNPEENVITVQNYKTRFEDLFQRLSATVQTVEYNEATYAKISTLLDANGTLNQNVLLQSLNNISGQNYSLTSDGSVLIDGDNILIRNLTNRANLVKINSEGIRVSSDGGENWTTAIDGQGINVDTIYTGVLNTNEIIIGNRSYPSFRWDKSGISAYKKQEPTRAGEQPYDLQTFVRFDQWGLYGIKNNDSFKAEELQDVKDKAHFAITWDGFFIRNKYLDGNGDVDGRVSITSENDFQVIQGDGPNEVERIKIGSLGIDPNTNERIYGINISNKNGQSVFVTNNEGDISITGTIYATGGTFKDVVRVGEGDPYIKIDGVNASIETSNFGVGAGGGWQINANGDATFNNITARGAIKTAVFEYAEIQAVGGIFIFRPSSVIQSARISEEDERDLVLKVDKPLLFAKITYDKIDEPSGNPQAQNWYEKTNYGYQLTEDTTVISDKKYFIKNEVNENSWCKISNYVSENSSADSTIQNILLTNGLTHVYKVSYIDIAKHEVTLQGASVMVSGNNAVTTLKELEGGALVDMGREDGSTNYGIGINSSDNTVNLPARSISLFETEINPNALNDIKVSYHCRGILGTLPELPITDVDDDIYNKRLAGTQGIYTDNMYLGDANQYLTFYTDENNNKQLKIRASKIEYELDGNYIDVSEPQISHIWFGGTGDNSGAHVASGNSKSFDTEDSSTYGYNSLMASNKLALRNNNQDLLYLDDKGLHIMYWDNDSNQNIEVATYSNSIILGNVNDPVHIEIDKTGLGFYQPYIITDNEDENVKARNKAKTTYIENNKLFIPLSVVLDEMVVGSRAPAARERRGLSPIYIKTTDTAVQPGKDYYRLDNNNEYVKIKNPFEDNPRPDPTSEGWYEVDESDLWAWRVTDDEHLRLVWKASVVI